MPPLVLLAVVIVAIPLAACATIAPPRPRFVAVFEQRSEWCRIQIIQDSRSLACFVAFRCGRQPVSVLPAEDAVCVP
jgi:hypothetical protein